MLEEKSIIDQITLTNTGHIMCRQSNLILKDGVEISRTYHRATFYPGQVPDMALFSGDVSKEDESNILKAVEMYHTKAVIQAYQDNINQEI